MYSVMLLDDEPWELKSLALVFPWKEYGFEIRYELDNSLEAQNKLLNHEIDVLVSDIRMPGMDGIELLASLRQNNISTEIIFLTGHAEFEYAQKALKLGAYDFFLKPIDLDITSNILDKLRKHLDQKQLVKNLILTDQITNHKTSIASFFKNQNHSCSYYALLSDSDLTKPLNDFKSSIHIIEINLAPKRYLYLLELDNIFVFQKNIGIMLKNSHCGLSECTSDQAASAYYLIQQAEIAYHTSFIINKNEFYTYHDINFQALQSVISKSKLLLDKQSFSQLSGYFDELPIYFYEQSITLTGVLKFWNQMLIYTVEDPDILTEYHIIDINAMLERFPSFSDLLLCLLEIIQTQFHQGSIITSELKRSDNEKLYSIMVNFIEENFSKPITLQDVADKTYVSFAYASKIFHKHAGITYSKYLTNRRIQAACHLLETTGLSISEICFHIGYDDYFYFNKVFKKEMNLTPNQYRKILNISKKES